MAKKRSWTEKKFARFLKEGRGQGTLADYKPWITIHDQPSYSHQSRCHGWKTSRLHHFQSDLELSYFYLLEWSDKIVDIREKFPLIEVSEAQTIAKQMGISYPTDQTTKEPLVLTTDFLLTVETDKGQAYIARSVLPEIQLEKPRTLERLGLERRYWATRGIDWKCVTDKQIPKVMVRNISYLYSGYRLEATERYSIETLRSMLPKLAARLKQGQGSIQSVLDQFDTSFNLDDGTANYLFKHLLATKQILVDMNQVFDSSQSVKVLTFIDSEQLLGAVSG